MLQSGAYNLGGVAPNFLTGAFAPVAYCEFRDQPQPGSLTTSQRHRSQGASRRIEPCQNFQASGCAIITIHPRFGLIGTQLDGPGARTSPDGPVGPQGSKATGSLKPTWQHFLVLRRFTCCSRGLFRSIGLLIYVRSSIHPS